MKTKMAESGMECLNRVKTAQKSKKEGLTTTTTTTTLFLTLNIQISHHLQTARLIEAGGV